MATGEEIKLPLTSRDVHAERLAQFRELFPEAFTEGKADLKKLAQLLADAATDAPERYGLSWAGKSDAIRAIQVLSPGTLLPVREESVNFDTTENLIIEGDNLEVLKLLQGSYHGRVKMIYIDPPYNTGGDFIYPDNYKEGLADYLKFSGQASGDGVRLTTNLETDGRYHSKWLTMMYPRLFLARNLLDKNGVLFVSIGDHEIHNLRSILDEIFGSENYINTVCVKAKPSAGASGGGEDKRLKKNVEFLLVYVRDRFSAAALNLEAAFEEIDLMEHIASMREDEKSWKYTRALTDSGTRQFLATTLDGDGNEIKIYEHDHFRFQPIADLMTEGKTEQQVYSEYFESIFRDTNAQSSIRTRVIEAVGAKDGLFSIEYVPRSGRNKGKLTTVFYKGTNKDQLAWLKDVARKQNGNVVFKEKIGTLWSDFNWNNVSKEGDMPFPNGKKPVAFIQRMLSLATAPDEEHVILDFFAGSGSTAHAVLEQNTLDGGNRRSILVQLPEPTRKQKENGSWEETDAWKAGFRTVADMTKERVRRVIQKLSNAKTQRNEDAKKELKLDDKAPEPELDLGFKVFKLSNSNFKVWDRASAPRDAAGLAEQLNLIAHNVVENRGDEALLYELILKSNLPLTSKIESGKIGAHTFYNVADGTLAICLERPVTHETLRGLIARKPRGVICLDIAFAGNDQLKTNTVLEMKTNGIEFHTA